MDFNERERDCRTSQCKLERQPCLHVLHGEEQSWKTNLKEILDSGSLDGTLPFQEVNDILTFSSKLSDEELSFISKTFGIRFIDEDTPCCVLHMSNNMRKNRESNKKSRRA